MEYLSFLSCCCKKDDTSNTIKISCNLNCFKNKTFQININDEKDVEDVKKIFELLEKINKSNNNNKKKNP